MKPVFIIVIVTVVIGIVGIMFVIQQSQILELEKQQNFRDSLAKCDWILPNVNFMNSKSTEVSYEWESCYDDVFSMYGTELDKKQWILDKLELEKIRQNPRGTSDDELFTIPDTYSGMVRELENIKAKYPEP